MQIKLQQVKPQFLEENKISGSGIWNQELIFQQGEFIQVLAPSGTGKTSLVHFLYMVRKDYAGNILFDNKNVADFSAEQKANCRESQISIVFQDLRLFPDKKAEENIRIKQVLNSYPEAASINEMAAQLGIEDKLQQRAGICSYGEQQRIAIIRALQQPYNFLILDEPFSHLDEANSRKAMDLILAETRKRQAGIIMAGLDEDNIFKADKTYLL